MLYHVSTCHISERPDKMSEGHHCQPLKVKQKDQGGWSDVFLQGHHLKIFQVQAEEALQGEASMKNDEVTRGWEGKPWVCVCVRNEQRSRVGNDCALIFESTWFLVCQGCCSSIVVVWSSDGAVVVFNFFRHEKRGAGVSRPLLLSVLSLVMVVLMMLLMFFMSAKMWAMRCWRVWGAVPAECYSDHHQSSQRVICWIIQLMKLQKYYSITISLCKSLRCYFTCCQCC